jgi:arginine repressor
MQSDNIRQQICTIITQQHVSTQREIKEALAEAGVVITQPSVCRHLRAVGAWRKPDGESFRYVLSPPPGEDDATLSELADRVALLEERVEGLMDAND